MYETGSRGAAPKIRLKQDMLCDYLQESPLPTLGCLGFGMVCLLLFAVWALHEVRHPQSPTLPYCRQEQGLVWLFQSSAVATCTFKLIRHILTKAWIIDIVNWGVCMCQIQRLKLSSPMLIQILGLTMGLCPKNVALWWIWAQEQVANRYSI